MESRADSTRSRIGPALFIAKPISPSLASTKVLKPSGPIARSSAIAFAASILSSEIARRAAGSRTFESASATVTMDTIAKHAISSLVSEDLSSGNVLARRATGPGYCENAPLHEVCSRRMHGGSHEEQTLLTPACSGFYA